MGPLRRSDLRVISFRPVITFPQDSFVPVPAVLVSGGRDPGAGVVRMDLIGQILPKGKESVHCRRY